MSYNDSKLRCEPCQAWNLRTQSLSFGSVPKIMGILNVTPDSFSDGGVFYSTQAAIDRALRMEDVGADIIDVGGESTRPYAEPVALEVELQRIIPIFEGLNGRLRIPLSIDTTKAAVAEAAIERGAEIINDISGCELDPRMLDVARKSQAGICAMHMQGTPQNMQENPSYQNVVEEVFAYLKLRDEFFLSHAIDSTRICLDPGIGFGKTHEHNLELLRSADVFHQLGRPLLIGHSRKGFIAKVIGDKQCCRTAGSIGVSIAMALKGIQLLRVHDVAETRQALQLYDAIR